MLPTGYNAGDYGETHSRGKEERRLRKFQGGRQLKSWQRVIEPLPNAMFPSSWKTSTRFWRTFSGKMRKNFIRILAGDKVAVELSPYDLTRGRIVYRYK